MTNKKMQCYVKSVRTDTDSILKDLKPAIINFLIKFSILIGVMFTVAILFTIITYGEPYIISVFGVIDSLLKMMLSQGIFTQYNTYLIIMILIDLTVLWFVRDAMTTSNFDSSDRAPFSQIVFGIMVLFLVFAFNAVVMVACFMTSSEGKFVGWSFMLSETIINMIVVVVGILLIRAYLKCENKIIPDKPSDWDSLSDD
jgi:hypothetical protein